MEIALLERNNLAKNESDFIKDKTHSRRAVMNSFVVNK